MAADNIPWLNNYILYDAVLDGTRDVSKVSKSSKKLSYCRGTEQCIMSVEILSVIE